MKSGHRQNRFCFKITDPASDVRLGLGLVNITGTQSLHHLPIVALRSAGNRALDTDLEYVLALSVDWRQMNLHSPADWRHFAQQTVCRQALCPAFLQFLRLRQDTRSCSSVQLG